MINFQKLLIKITFAMMMLMIIPISVDAYGYDRLDQIKIGIRFGENATPLVSMGSSDGLEFGYYEASQFVSMISFFDNKEMIVRKDGNFIRVNESFMEYDFTNQIDSYNTNVQGPIHIQIGNELSSKEEAEAFLHSLPELKDDPYLVYEDGWRVWIGLCTSFSDAENLFENIKVLLPNTDLRIISKDDQRIQVLNKYGKVLFMYKNGNVDYQFRPFSGILQLDGKTFRGSIMIKRYSDSDLTVINQLGVEEYLYGVVPKEMAGNWPIEAQKAQAVAARSYAALNINKHKNYGFDLCSATHCQVYGGYSSENPRTKIAVDETRGKVMTYNGKVVTAFYHSNSGGRTEDSENIWSNPLGYIRGVDDPYSIGLPNAQWTKVYTKQQIEDLLNAKGMFVGNVTNIIAKERSRNGRVLKLEVQGTNGNQILQKGQIRSVFGYTNLKSTWFDIMADGKVTGTDLSDLNNTSKEISTENKYVLTAEGLKETTAQNQYIDNGEEKKRININDKYVLTAEGLEKIKFKEQSISNPQKDEFTVPNISKDQYVFVGKGYGHGAGMSQWGAKKMAEQGFTYEQILSHYYTGIRIE
ncbi:SpoIID/LytB domain-containing protein [Crassaminicella profunda]|uniref:SpoIID/LytB domain-containing protein n=1 Tax=Crassaminicella profunda TaxID=1286698 RepID=UPI001CA62064|nr:SpoIID/LytB domain-containing protein [Crassaminicella profunda]QZY57058.1 SpoIID/LytB domain-containing protein [Crassaminicella profunda]